MNREDIVKIYLQVSDELCDGKEWCWTGAGEPLQRFAKLAAAAEREACIKVIKAYQIPVGKSAAGEMARDWTVDALKYIRDEIRARGEIE